LNNDKGDKLESNRLYEDKYFAVISPAFPLNSREDGGHLILIKKDKVSDRSDLTMQEAIDFMRISMIVGKAMYNILKIERMNYEDLGNWSIDEPDGAKMHLHFFGRAKIQIHQIRGHHIFLYPKDHNIYKGHLNPLNIKEIDSLKIEIENISKEEKYVKMAELAGI
jgi:diadenosine tetraphosphate (Ap4A) HIT family hydrolase